MQLVWLNWDWVCKSLVEADILRVFDFRHMTSFWKQWHHSSTLSISVYIPLWNKMRCNLLNWCDEIKLIFLLHICPILVTGWTLSHICSIEKIMLKTVFLECLYNKIMVTLQISVITCHRVVGCRTFISNDLFSYFYRDIWRKYLNSSDAGGFESESPASWSSGF